MNVLVFILMSVGCLIRKEDHGNENGGSYQEEVAVVGIEMEFRI